MRKKITLFCLLGLFGALKAQSVPELLWYKFDGVGTSVPNLASSPPTGTTTATLMGGITQGGSGLCAGTAIGSGVSSTTDYVNTGWAPNLGTGSWTISFRTSGISTNATLYYVFGDINTNSLRCFTNGVAGSTNYILRGAGLTDVLINGGALATPTMMTYVYDQTLNNVKGYLNGVLVNTVTQTAPNLTGTGPFKVVGYSANVGAPAGGLLDDFRVYNRALPANEILSIYSSVATGFLGPDQLICNGDSIQLGAPSGGSSYSWSTGSTVDSVWVNAANTYSVSFSGTCESGADTIVLTAASIVPSPGFAGPDDTICTGDTLALSFATTDNVLWSTGDTAHTIYINSPGLYTISVQGFCGSASDTIRIDSSMLVYSNFAVVDSNVVNACEGDTVMLYANGFYDSYLWSNGDINSSTWVTSSGAYTLSVNDGCGTGTDTVIVSMLAPLAAGFTSSAIGYTVTFVDGSTGSGPFTYAWDFGDGNTSTSASPIHVYTANGTYLVSLTVTSPCGVQTVTDTLVFNIIGISNALDLNVKVFPNPAKDQVAVAAEIAGAQDLHLSIVSVVGQVMYKVDFKDVNGSLRHNIDLSQFAAGVYFLTLEGIEGKHVTRLVVE